MKNKIIKNHLFSKCLLTLILLFCFILQFSVQGVVYVNKNAIGANNGNSWADAYTTIQAGINDADIADEEVWVAQGTYPEAITMLSGVKLYGGFNGTETELNQRNWTTNVTTIDASTARGGLPAYHVVIMSNITNATIDGFKITGGKANGGGTNDYGGGIFCYSLNDTNLIANNKITGNSAYYYGGIYCDHSSPEITNNTISGNSATGTYSYGGGISCYYSLPQITNNTISGNSAYYGGGIYCEYSSPAISNNTISGNSAYDGGGIYCEYSSSPSITNNTISGNSANRNGGGIYCYSSSPSITNNIIAGNLVGNYGGGIYCEYSSPAISNNTISGNSANYGGGIDCVTSSSAAITNNIISGNLVKYGGGGIDCYYYSSPAISNNTISGNSAYYNGGGISCEYQSSPAISNNIISGNSANYSSGGGISCDYSSWPAISNNTISGNSADNYGGGIYCYYVCSPSITNNTIAGNSASIGGGGIFCYYYSSPTITNNTISGNSANDSGGGISCYYSSSPAITNNTISGNSANDSGGGIYCTNNSDPQIKNTIFSANNKYDIYEADSSSDTAVTYNDFYCNPDGVYYDEGITPYTSVAAMDSAIAECSNNIGLDPLFVGDTLSGGSWTAAPVYNSTTFQTTLTDSSAAWTANEHARHLLNPDISQNRQFVIVSNTATTMTVWGNVTAIAQIGGIYKIFDYHLQLASPCIDAGYDQDVPNIDFDDEPRPMNVFGIDNNGPLAEYDIGADEYTMLNVAPNQPSNVSPFGGETEISITPILESSPFSDSDIDSGDSHYSSQWQVDNNSDFSSPEYDIGEDITNKISITIPGGYLVYEEDYWWRVKYSDDSGASNRWSEWSNPTDFTTQIAPPETPSNPLPNDGLENVPITTNFNWDDCARATSYDLYLWKSFDIKPSTPTASDLTVSEYDPPSNLDYTTEYKWQVIAKNTTGNTPGAEWRFTTQIAPPEEPSTPLPTDLSTNVSITTNLDWSDCARATSYDLYFWKSSDVKPATPTASDLAVSEYDPPSNLDYVTEYKWQVIAKNSTGNTPGAEWLFATQIAPPEEPTSPSPADLSTNISIVTNSDWTDCARATSYDLYFWKATETKPSTPTASDLTVSEYDPPSNLDYDTEYKWQVIAKNTTGNTPGAEWRFTTQIAPPEEPSSPLPTDTSTNISIATNLDWSDSARATSYDIYFWKSSDAKPPTPTASDLAVSEYDPSGNLDYATEYKWQVIAKNTTGNTPGAEWRFTTQIAPPEEPTSPSPADLTINISITTNLDWSDCARATSYDLYFWKVSETKPSIPTVSDLIVSIYDPPSDLEYDIGYKWQVIAKNNTGQTQGDEWLFTTESGKPEKPSSPSPPHLSFNVSIDTEFDWADCARATAYDVYIWLWGDPEPGDPTASDLIDSRYLSSDYLLYNKQYEWRVIAKNSFGSTEGDEWVIRTCIGPSARIDSPQLDQEEILTGDSINFSGTATGYNLTYLWKFDGAAPDSNQEDPGDIIFNQRGIYTIIFGVRDEWQNYASDSVTVIVKDPDPDLVSLKLLDQSDFSEEETDSQLVKVEIETTGSEPTHIILSEKENFDGAPWQLIQNPIIFRLTSKNGPKTVYAKVGGLYINESNVLSDSIILNTYDNSHILSDTIPSEMSPGQKYKVSVTLQNTGASIWPQGWDIYRLGAVGDSDPLGGNNRYPMTKDVYPNYEVTIEYYLTAPTTTGTYTTDWRMVKEGEHWFGEKLVKQVTVKDGLKKNNSAYVIDYIPEEVSLKQSRLFIITFKNTGNATWTKTDLYKLGISGDRPLLGCPGRVELTNDVFPGEETTVNFWINPTQEGEYTITLRMLQENVEWFGESIIKTIQVTKYTEVDEKIFELYE